MGFFKKVECHSSEPKWFAFFFVENINSCIRNELNITKNQKKKLLIKSQSFYNKKNMKALKI
ncbi:hypothetical protein BsIDN1_58410 [Bacillus safensis]|uniref:Uncharacterized protein n=1 Tax=Bacillus safensis TaxID=561879 RepID=A0A5S9MGL2_BACIA|nr:hypothetical protein BsIDN1_58410 [Bacillus safensis]